MKDVDLYRLKVSKHLKHNKIYDKVIKMLEKDHYTAQYSDEEIVEMAKKFPNLRVDIKAHGDIFVRSLKDTWVIRDEEKFFSLHHRAVKFDNGRLKDMYHIQDVYWDLEYIFASIVSHDEYAMGIATRSPEEVNDLVKECLAS